MNLFNLIPLALAYIMFVLGLQLRTKDFATIRTQPRALVVGLMSQMLMVPITAFVLVQLFNLSPEMKFGIMLLSFCAGGATSNLLSFYAGGNLALSVSLTAMSSLLSMITLPFFASITFTYFLGSDVPSFNPTKLSFAMFVLSTAPVLVGMVIRHYFERFVERFSTIMQRIVNILFALLVIAAVAGNFDVMVEQFKGIGALVLIMAAFLLVSGSFYARFSGMDRATQKTIAIETSLQNGAMGIALAPFIMPAVDGGLSVIAVPSAVYGVLMNAVILPYVWWCRRRMP